MSRRRLALGLLVLALAALALAAGGCGGSDTAAAGGKPTLLFMLRADGGAFTQQGEGRYELVFQPEMQVVAFTDRPDRQANHAHLSDFLSYWKDDSDFDETPPNAAIVAVGADGSEHVVVAKLEHPDLDAGANTLTFDATLVPDITTGALSVYGDAGQGEVPAEFVAASIFVDSNASPAKPPIPTDGIG